MIQLPKKICIDKSPVHGWGVFALEQIEKDELIEETPFFELFDKKDVNENCNKNILYDYRFAYPANMNWEKSVIPFGCGCIYNHSDENNAYWTTDEENKTFKFFAKRTILPGEEIFTYYGPVYYWNSRKHIEKK